MTRYNSLHLTADVDRLYVPRKEGGRGLANIQSSMNMEEQSLSIGTGEEELLTASKEENVLINWNGETYNHRQRLLTRISA